MIRIRKLPFPVNDELEFSGESTTLLTNYQLFPAEEIYYQTGNNLRFKGAWDKYQITVPVGNVIMDHLLLTNTTDKPFGSFPLYPVLTLVHPTKKSHYRCLPILHKLGITKIHQILNPKFKTYGPHFLAEYILEYILQDTDIRSINEEYTEDLLEGILEPQFQAMSYFHNEGQRDLVSCVNKIIHEIIDVFHAGSRHAGFPTKNLVEDILAPLFPQIPAEMQLHPFSRKTLIQEEITESDIRVAGKMDSIDYQEISDLDDMIQKRRDLADIDIDDIGFYPELIELYHALVNSGFTDVYLEYEFKEGSWVPTEKCECINQYRSEERDKDAEYNFILELESIISQSKYMKDVYSDLTSLEFDSLVPPKDDSLFGEIHRIEIVIANSSACVTVYSWGLSCATFIDYTVAALISNSLVSH